MPGQGPWREPQATIAPWPSSRRAWYSVGFAGSEYFSNCDNTHTEDHPPCLL